MTEPIVSMTEPVTLAGGAQIDDKELTISLSVAPRAVAADGGADRLLAAGVRPEAVIGDLDSLSAAGRAALAPVIHAVDEPDTTDFEKALTRIASPLVLALGFLGGRLDHTLAALNLLARSPDRRVILFGAGEIAFLVPGALRLRLAPGTAFALLPLGSARVTTRGLCWDLDARLMHPAGLVSSSNAVAAPEVTISTDGPVIATVPVAALNAVRDAFTAP